MQALARCQPATMIDLLTNYEDMPRYIFGLERAELLDLDGDTAVVRFTMNLPFPIGRVVWMNTLTTRHVGDSWSIDWTLVDGDLRVNEGRLILAEHGRHPFGTYARYLVRVESKSVLPSKAERLATRWLLPKIVGKLRRVVERQ